MLKGNEIRQLYLDFFEKKYQHTVVESSSLVPDNPTVLFWLIVALRKHGAIDMAKEHLESARIRLLREEYQELEERLIAV